jgi:hypothetical protein
MKLLMHPVLLLVRREPDLFGPCRPLRLQQLCVQLVQIWAEPSPCRLHGRWVQLSTKLQTYSSLLISIPSCPS